MNGQLLRIGLTGGIASGKSTVADLFAELGVPVIDTDLIARELVEPGMPALDAIRREFGDRVMVDGALDRAALRELVFASDERRHRLQGILHPLIREETLRQAESAGGPYQLIVVPLLAESPLKARVDRILVVDCEPEQQLGRLLKRDAESRDQAERMIAAQARREERLAIADDVVDNSGDLDDTRRQVQALHERYLELSRAG
ncbi:MAG: dephospho-CoA kinase [Woeseiaceae bacterium]